MEVTLQQSMYCAISEKLYCGADLAGGGGEHSEIPLVQSRFPRILPHHAVDRQVCIDERVMEPPATHILLCHVPGIRHDVNSKDHIDLPFSHALRWSMTQAPIEA